MNWNLNWIDSAPQEGTWIWIRMTGSGIKFMAIQRNSTQSECVESHIGDSVAQHNAFWLSQFVQIYLEYLIFPTLISHMSSTIMWICYINTVYTFFLIYPERNVEIMLTIHCNMWGAHNITIWQLKMSHLMRKIYKSNQNIFLIKYNY